MRKKKKQNRKIQSKRKQNRKIQSKRKQKKVLAAIGSDMRLLAVTVLGAGALNAALSEEPTGIALTMFMLCGTALWVCGILLTSITQE